MKSINLGEKVIDFDIGEEITVKELRKIYPFMQEKNEMEMMYNIVCALSNTPNVGDIVDSLTYDELTQLSEFVGKIIEVKKK